MKFAPLLGSNLTGRLGGIVASHNSSGTYFRRYVVPVNPNTSGQQAQRNAFAVVSQRWRGLNSTQQANWVAAGPQNTVPNSTGGSLQLTGQQLFMRMNTLRQRLGLSLLSDAPTSSEVPSITPPVCTIDLSGQCSITFDTADEWNAPGGGILVSCSPLLSAGRNFNNQFLTMIDGGHQGEVGTIEPSVPYSTTPGGRITFRFSAVTPDGRLSDYLYVDVSTPAQSLLLELNRVSATEATATFSGPVNAADFATGDFTGAWQTTVTAIAQDTANSLTLTGTVFTAGAAFDMSPSGIAATYVPPASGLTT